MAGIPSELRDLKDFLRARYKIKDLGTTRHLLGIRVDYNRNADTLALSQPAFIDALLRKMDIADASPVATPESSAVLTKAPPSQEEEKELARVFGADYASKFRFCVGSLLWISVSTRPDIAHATMQVARHVAAPNKSHFVAAKRILRYLAGTRTFGLVYRRDNATRVVGYSDANFAGDLDTRRSTSGSLFMAHNAAVLWRSRLQRSVALSTCESELMALCETGKMALWMTELLQALNKKIDGPMVIFEDNAAALQIARTGQRKPANRHIDVRYFWLHQKIGDNKLDLQKCPSQDMLADILTKSLPRDKFEPMRANIGVVDTKPFRVAT